MTTFTIKNPIGVKESVVIKNDCTTPPTDYTLGDTMHARIETNASGSTMIGLKAGETTVTPVGGDCTDSTAKTITINNDNEFFTEQGIQDIAVTEMVGLFIIGILVFIIMLGRR